MTPRVNVVVVNFILHDFVAMGYLFRDFRGLRTTTGNVAGPRKRVGA